jgi:uncharacterized repeat protein (TIGR01451 family)
MKQLYFLVYAFTVILSADAQIVNIPDANFKNALVNTNCVTPWYGLEPGELPIGDVDTNNDGEIQVSEAAAVQGLKISNQNIASLIGIESFTNLGTLDCSYNQLTSLTVTMSSVLINLDCSHNQLTSLTSAFYLNGDQMFEMQLDCSYNQLTALVIPTGWRYYVYCDNNPLTQISQESGSNNYIEMLSANNTHFTHFDPPFPYRSLSLANCPFMTSCEISGSYYVNVYNNPALLHAKVWSSGQKNMNNNPLLQSIDLKDGYAPMNIGDMDDPDYDFTNNPSLEFVCIDDLGNWHDEGGNVFFNHEKGDVSISPGVAFTYYCDFAPGGGYNTITGSIHYDCGGVNTALTNEDGELNLVNSNGTSTVNPNAGNFTFYTVGNGTVTPSLGNNYFTITPANYPYNFTGTGNTQNLNFCVTPNGVHPDVEVTVLPTTPAVPGFDANYKIVYTNKGTETQSGSVTLAFEDDLTDFVSANPASATQTDGLLTWNFSDLAPFETREITVTVNVNTPLETPAVIGGDILDFTASIATVATDETPADNANTLAQVVVNSFDPNDKAVSRQSIAPAQLNDYLYYTVRFQNTGTFQAQNVVIRDLIDQKLDFNSLEVIASSHQCRSVMTPHTNTTPGTKAEFIFEGINLPAEQDNEPGSHGFVTYRIKPDSNLVLNDVISNTAEIYFDYNAPIITNTVTTTVSALGVGQPAENLMSVYPNPAKHNVTIALHSHSIVTGMFIYNMLGQLVKTIDPAFNGQSMTVDIASLNAGTYLIQVNSGATKTIKKLVKL